MFRRKKLLKRMYQRRAELVGYMKEYAIFEVPLHTQGMYDELNRWINILEGRE